MIIGLAGLAGSGKDTVADILVRERGFVKIALADEIKRICKRVFAFSDEQLWGPSEKRNAPDERYPRTEWEQDPYIRECLEAHTEYLTPRYALQKLGTEWGRECYENVWINLALRDAREVLENRAGYTQAGGLDTELQNIPSPCGVVIPDVRFVNEARAIVAAGGAVIVIARPGAGLSGAAGAHASEQGLGEIIKHVFTRAIWNGGTLDELRDATLTVLELARMDANPVEGA